MKGTSLQPKRVELTPKEVRRKAAERRVAEFLVLIPCFSKVTGSSIYCLYVQTRSDGVAIADKRSLPISEVLRSSIKSFLEKLVSGQSTVMQKNPQLG